MVKLRLCYRDRVYRPSIVGTRLDEVNAELAWLLQQRAVADASLYHGQFEHISAALEVVFSQPNGPTTNMFAVVERNYQSSHVRIRVPLSFFFHATVAVESFFTLPTIREQELSLPVLRERLKRRPLWGSASTPMVFVWSTLWSLPSSVPIPVLQFPSLVEKIHHAPCVHSSLSTKAHFHKIWDAVTATLCIDCAMPTLSCRFFGRRWSLIPTRLLCLDATLSFIEILQSPPVDILAMEAAWGRLHDEYCQSEAATLPPGNVFDVDHPTVQACPAARAPRAYHHEALPFADTSHRFGSKPEGRGCFWCRLCDWHSESEVEWAQHCEGHNGIDNVRLQHLAMESQAWPSVVPPVVVRHCMQTYAKHFWCDMSSKRRLCASCALPNTAVKLTDVDLRSPPFDPIALHPCLSAREYVQRHSSLYDMVSDPAFSGLDLETVLLAGVPVPASVQTCAVDAWLLHLSPTQRDTWHAQAQHPHLPLHCILCEDCSFSLGRGRLPARALANGNLCLSLPSSLQDLTIAECIFIARGYTVCRLKSLPGRVAPQDRQRGLTGNTISFPQNGAEVFQILPRSLQEAGALLTVLFPAVELCDVQHGPAFTVRQSKIREALMWLRAHNPFYSDIEIAEDVLSTFPEGSVPQQFLIPTDADVSLSAEVGPADAMSTQESGPAEPLPLASAVLDVEGEGIPPLELWRNALPQPAAQPVEIVVPHGGEPLSAFDPAYWVYCFPHLFPYGDGIAAGARMTQFPLRSWARHLLLRADRSGENFLWSLDLDFVAVLFSVLHRQDLFRAVKAKVSSRGFSAHLGPLLRLGHTDFATVGAVLGDSGGLPQALSHSHLTFQLFFC